MKPFLCIFYYFSSFVCLKHVFPLLSISLSLSLLTLNPFSSLTTLFSPSRFILSSRTPVRHFLNPAILHRHTSSLFSASVWLPSIILRRQRSGVRQVQERRTDHPSLQTFVFHIASLDAQKYFQTIFVKVGKAEQTRPIHLLPIYFPPPLPPPPPSSFSFSSSSSSSKCCN